MSEEGKSRRLIVLIRGLEPATTITHVLKLHREWLAAEFTGFLRRGDNGRGKRLKWLVSWQRVGRMQEACAQVYPLGLERATRELGAFIFELGAEFLMPGKEDVVD